MSNDKKTILIVEDNEDLLTLIEMDLSSEGYTLLTADNGKVAQQLLLTHKVDYLLTDLMMPEMDGKQLITWLKKQPLEQPKIIILTAVTSDEVMAQLHEVGVDKVLIKAPQLFSETGLLAKEIQAL